MTRADAALKKVNEMLAGLLLFAAGISLGNGWLIAAGSAMFFGKVIGFFIELINALAD